jgi:hypothetical protein
LAWKQHNKEQKARSRRKEQITLPDDDIGSKFRTAFTDINKIFPEVDLLNEWKEDNLRQTEMAEASVKRALERVNKTGFSSMQRMEAVERVEDPDSGLYRDIAVRLAENELKRRLKDGGLESRYSNMATWAQEAEAAMVTLGMPKHKAMLFAMQCCIRETVNTQLAAVRYKHDTKSVHEESKFCHAVHWWNMMMKEENIRDASEREKAIIEEFSGRRGEEHGETKLTYLLHHVGLTADFSSIGARAVIFYRACCHLQALAEHGLWHDQLQHGLHVLFKKNECSLEVECEVLGAGKSSVVIKEVSGSQEYHLIEKKSTRSQLKLSPTHYKNTLLGVHGCTDEELLGMTRWTGFRLPTSLIQYTQATSKDFFSSLNCRDMRARVTLEQLMSLADTDALFKNKFAEVNLPVTDDDLLLFELSQEVRTV